MENSTNHDDIGKISILRRTAQGILWLDTGTGKYCYETLDYQRQFFAFWNGAHWRGYVWAGNSQLFNYQYPEAQCAEDTINELIRQHNIHARVSNNGKGYEELHW